MTAPRPSFGLLAFGLAVAGFVWLPLIIVASVSFSTLNYVAFPPVGFTLNWYGEIARRPEFIESFTLSVRLAALTSLIVGIVGTLAGIAVARYSFPGRASLRTLFLSPLLLPALVFGLALLQFFAALNIDASIATLAAGHVIVTAPFLIRLVILAASAMDPNLERAAQTLGASPRATFWKVTFPLIRPGILAGLALVFIWSFDEVPVSLLNSAPTLVTLPVRTYQYVELLFDPFITAVGTVMMVLAAICVIIIERFFGLARLFGLEDAKRRD